MKRLLSPTTNLTGLISAGGVVWTAAVMIWNVTHHEAVFDPQEAVAAVTAVLAFAARQTVTPVADPKDGSGRPLVPAQPPPLAVVVPGQSGKAAALQGTGQTSNVGAVPDPPKQQAL